MSTVVISASFDNARSTDFLFADLASRIGELHVLLWSDDTVRVITGSDPKFPQAEREYLVQAMRYVSKVIVVDLDNADVLPVIDGLDADVWASREADRNNARESYCESAGIVMQVISDRELTNFPDVDLTHAATGNKTVVVTGCYDWFHSGHIAFFEEVSALGDLYVVVGHDANIRLLKGEGHPMFSEKERRYVVASIRYVHRALISSGNGWMDAEPEIEQIKPDMYAVNEDGDKPEKRLFCSEHGLEYVVLKRLPKEGLPRRESTHLRGF